MKFFALVLAAVLLSVLASLFFIEDTGYVLFQYAGWRVETSLTFFALLNFILFFSLYVIFRLLLGFVRGPDNIRLWGRRRVKIKSQKELMNGLFSLIDGDWKVAEKLLEKHAKNSDVEMLHYLAAAFAAHKQHSLECRDHYLRLAAASVSSADLAVGLTQVYFYMEDDNTQSSQNRLDQLRLSYPKDKAVLRLQVKLYQHMHAWDKLEALLTSLKKHKVFSDAELEKITQAIFSGLLERSGQKSRPDQLFDVWQRMPKVYKKNNVLLIDYVLLLCAFDKTDEAEKLIRQQMKGAWSERLVYAYAQIESNDAMGQLSFSEKYLVEHPNNPVLLMSLGRLAIRSQLWGKARSYLESSLGVMPGVEVYYLLAQLMEQLNEDDLVKKYSKEGLALAYESTR